MKKNGYTLVELLAVLVILALLSVIVSYLVGNVIDKAKNTATKAQDQSILQAAEKWSIDYSEEFDEEDNVKLKLGLDVVFIIDISSSMFYYISGSELIDGEETRRTVAMTEAFNVAMSVLEGDNNRQAVIMYGGTVATPTFMPLGSYTSDSKVYMKMSNGNAAAGDNSFITGADLKKDGVPYSKEQKYIGGTNTQGGIIEGSKILLNVSDSEVIGRIPVVILFTDGDPSRSNPSLCEKCDTYKTKEELGMGDDVWYGPHFYYALMAGYEYSQKITEHYRNEVKFYTIGLGLNTGYDNVHKLLDPASVEVSKPYDYVTKAFMNQNMSPEELKLIFENISTEVIESSKVYQVCVSYQELYELGYLNKDDIELESGDLSSNYVMVSYSEFTKQFKYEIAKTPAQKDACVALRAS